MSIKDNNEDFSFFKCIEKIKNISKNLKKKTIKVYNPQNFSVLDDKLILNLNKDIARGHHGTSKYVHGIADHNILNLIKKQNKSAFGKAFDIKVCELKIIKFKNCYINDQMILFDSYNKKVVQENINSYWDWDDNLAPNLSFSISLFDKIVIKLSKILSNNSSEKEFVTRKKIAFKKYANIFFGPKKRMKKLNKYIKIVNVERALVFTDQYFYVFGHFFHENYPRLYYALSKINKTNLKIILPPKLNYDGMESASSKFIRPCLEALDIKEEQCLYINYGDTIKVKQLFLPSPIRFHPIVSESLKYLQNYFCKKEDHKYSNYKKIYISRRSAPRRKIVNEDEVVKYLNEIGFNSIIIEDFSFEEQMKILSNVEVFIAQDSSSLTNVIFCQNCKDVLIFTCDKITAPFFSADINARFYYQFCEPEDRENFNWYSSNIIVDIKKLKENMEIILNN